MVLSLKGWLNINLFVVKSTDRQFCKYTIYFCKFIVHNLKIEIIIPKTVSVEVSYYLKLRYQKKLLYYFELLQRKSFVFESKFSK